MGEAALTGVPVVCTDVGASFRVVTDMATGKRFSSVVAPNDSLSLARAQVKVLALLDEWSEFADDAPGTEAPKMPIAPTKAEGQTILARMYAKQEQRRKLGMMGRANVLSSFSSERYLQEHEQMLWIGKCQSPSHRAKVALGLSDIMGSELMSSSSSFYGGKFESPGFTPGNMSPAFRSGLSTPDFRSRGGMSGRSSFHMNRNMGGRVASACVSGTATPGGYNYNLNTPRMASTVISSRASLLRRNK
jgi:hypothetical protein